MKKRWYALGMAVMMLLVPVGGLASGEAGTALPGDTVIQFPDPAFEAAVRENNRNELAERLSIDLE
jgi:hypothetical protein